MPDASPNINTGTSIESVANSVYGDAWKSAQKFDKETEAGIQKMENEKIPSPPELKEAPKPENYQTDPIQSFGSAAMFLATFGSLLTKRPLESALNSGAEVMKAINAKDASSFKQATEKWKIDTENAWKMADYNQQLYKDVIGKDEAELKARAVSAKDNVMVHMSDAKMAVLGQRDRDRNARILEETHQAQLYAGTKMQESADKGDPPLKQMEVYQEALGNAKERMSGKDGGALTDEKYNQLKDDPAMQLALRAYKVSGDPRKALGGGTMGGKALIPKIEALQRMATEEDPNFNPAVASLKYKGTEREMSTVSLSAGKIQLASNILDTSLPSLMESAKKLDLSDIKGINKLYNSAREQMNDADFKNFSTQMRAVATDYGQFIGRTQGTVHSDEEALRILNEGMSDKSLQGFADAVNTERNNVQKGVDKTLSDIETKASGEQSPKPVSLIPEGAPTATDAQGNKVHWNGKEWIK